MVCILFQETGSFASQNITQSNSCILLSDGRQMLLENEKYLSQFDVISFDIFDTLLLRRVQRPSDVWLELERREGAKGYFKDRKKADAETYAAAIARGGETTLDEAYGLIPQWQDMKEKELALERKMLHANSEMLEIWNYLGSIGKKRVVVSDMYLPGDFIRNVLKENGIDGWDGFYLSNEHNCRKSSGQLFKVMLGEQVCSPEKVLHVGDNELSDVKVPRTMGIVGRLYRKGEAWLAFVSYWTGLGYRIGGSLGYMYVSWIVKTARKLGKTHLMFVGRDGYILEKICNELWPEIRTDYFFAPRIVSIKTLGVIGCDPFALADRRKYLEEHLCDNEPEKARELYGNYLSNFTIDEDTALVDGCSSGFSAQRLVEDTVGHRVFTFYLVAMGKMSYGAALYSTQMKVLPFQLLSEFIFGAPTPPVVGVDSDGIVFSDDYGNEERFKIQVSKDICVGVLKKARELRINGVRVSPSQWYSFANQFMSNLSFEDVEELTRARNALDICQKQFHSVIWKPANTGRTVAVFCGKILLAWKRFFFKGRYCSVLMFCRLIPVMIKWLKLWDEDVVSC